MRSSAACIATVLTLACPAAEAISLSPLDLSSGSTGFANTPNAGLFVDTTTFTLTTTSALNGSLISGVLGNQDVDFTSIQIAGPGGTFSFSLLNPDPFETYGFGATLSPGAYTLTVTGSNSAGIGSYAGNLATTSVTVPSSGAAGPGATPAAALGSLDLSSGSTGFFSTPIVGAFTDVATFTLVAPTSAVGAITTAVNGNQDIDFTSIFVTGPGGVFAFTQLLADPYEAWVLPAAAQLAAGAYSLTLAGTNSSGQGSYAGTFAVGAQVVQAVPEPATPALVLVALAGGTLVARRRRR